MVQKLIKPELKLLVIRLFYGYSVFGQVFEGLDVVSVINSVEVDENDKPLTDVVIETIEIVNYTK